MEGKKSVFSLVVYTSWWDWLMMQLVFSRARAKWTEYQSTRECVAIWQLKTWKLHTSIIQVGSSRHVVWLFDQFAWMQLHCTLISWLRSEPASSTSIMEAFIFQSSGCSLTSSWSLKAWATRRIATRTAMLGGQMPSMEDWRAKNAASVNVR